MNFFKITFLLLAFVSTARLVSATSLKALNCQVQSWRHPSLRSEENAHTICRDSHAALAEACGELPEASSLIVSANGQRSTYSVELVLKWYVDNKLKMKTPATLYWYPGDDYVVLKEF